MFVNDNVHACVIEQEVCMQKGALCVTYPVNKVQYAAMGLKQGQF